MTLPGGFEFIILMVTCIVFYFFYKVWRMIEKRKEQRQEMEILLLAKIAQQLGVDQSSISEIIKTL